MSEAAKDSRSALKVSPGLRPWAGVGLGAVGGDYTSRRGNPGAGILTQSSACSLSWEPKAVFPAPSQWWKDYRSRS